MKLRRNNAKLETGNKIHLIKALYTYLQFRNPDNLSLDKLDAVLGRLELCEELRVLRLQQPDLVRTQLLVCKCNPIHLSLC